MMEIEISFQKVEEFFTKHEKYIFLGVFAALLVLAFVSRAAIYPNLQHKYLLSPDDPYLFLRYSKYIAEHGKLMKNDTLRYYPGGYLTKRENTFTAYIAGYLSRAFGWNIFDIAAFLPAVCLTIATVFIFLLSNEFFENRWKSLIAAGLFAFSQGILFRTMGGFLEKEPVFLVFMSLALWLFVRAIKTEDWRFYLASGIATGFAGFASGLFIFIEIFVCGFMLVELVLGKFDRKKLMNFALWVLATLVVLNLLTSKYWSFKAMQNQIPIASLIITLGSLVNVEVKKVPKGIFQAIVGLAIMSGVGLGIYGSAFTDMATQYFVKFFKPIGLTAFQQSVSEYQPPTFFGTGTSWVSVFGWQILFFIPASIWLFYRTFKGKKYANLATVTFAIFIIALIFENATPGNSFLNIIFSAQKFYFALFVAGSIFLLLANKDLHEVDTLWLFALVWFVIGITAANSAVRLFFIFTLPAAFLTAFGIDEFTKLTQRLAEKEETKKIAKAAIFTLVLVWIFYSGIKITIATSHHNPGPYLQQWYDAMEWVRNSTPKDAVFVHWWDYGYMVQAKGERATVVDPGNVYLERDYDVGGHLFCAYNKSEVLQLLEKYGKPNYWMICSEDVLKYVQIARLGSLAPGAEGREMYFSLFAINPQHPYTVLNHTKYYVFTAASAPLQVKQNIEERGMILDGDNTYLVAFYVDENMTNAYGVFYNTELRWKFEKPIGCYCQQNVGCETRDGVGICLLPLRGGIVAFPIKGKDMLFTKLYLLNLTVPGFKLVYDNPQPLDAYAIAGQYLDIKIYEINYSELME